MRSLAEGMRNNLHLVRNMAAETAEALNVKPTSTDSFEQDYQAGRKIRPTKSFFENGDIEDRAYRTAPLIGELNIYQQPGETADDLADKVIKKAMRELSRNLKQGRLTIGTIGGGI